MFDQSDKENVTSALCITQQLPTDINTEGYIVKLMTWQGKLETSFTKINWLMTGVV